MLSLARAPRVSFERCYRTLSSGPRLRLSVPRAWSTSRTASASVNSPTFDAVSAQAPLPSAAPAPRFLIRRMDDHGTEYDMFEGRVFSSRAEAERVLNEFLGATQRIADHEHKQVYSISEI